MLPLHAREFGTPGRPAVVLLHGLFGSASNWGAVARRLETRFHVIVPDLRNHGQSPHDSRHDYDLMVEDVLALLRRQQIDRAVLVGHSMGGKVAMHLALRHSQWVRGMVAVDIAPVRYGHDFNAVLAAFHAVDLGALRSRQDADAQMAAQVSPAGIRAFLLQNLVKRDGAWQWRLNLAALAAAQREIVGFPDQPEGAVYRGPAAFIYGELSDYVSADHEAPIRRYFPNARLYPVGAAGHWVYADQPKGFAACLNAFLQDIEDRV